MQSIEAVSYTHLDVYKRQVLDKGQIVLDGKPLDIFNHHRHVLQQEMCIRDSVRDGIRILGNGSLETKNLTVIANGFTKSAEEKITAAGGKVEVI